MKKIIYFIVTILLASSTYADTVKVRCDLENRKITEPDPHFPGFRVNKNLASVEIQTKVIGDEPTDIFRAKFLDYDLEFDRLSDKVYNIRVGGSLKEFYILIGSEGCEVAVEACAPVVLSLSHFNLESKQSSARISFLDYSLNCKRLN